VNSSPGPSTPEAPVLDNDRPASRLMPQLRNAVQPEASSVTQEVGAVGRPHRVPWATSVMTTGMLVATLIGFYILLRFDTPDGLTDYSSWWVLAIGFVLAESMVVHLPVQRDSHTISMSEIPLVIGLALAPPIAVVFARLVAGALVLTLRRQPLLKLTFNLSLFTLETTVALVVYRSILGMAQPWEPVGWLAAMVAIGVAVTVSAALVDIVIALNDRRRRLREIVRSFAVGSLISIAVGFLGTIAVVIIHYQPRAIVLLAVTMAFLFMLFRSFGRLSLRHDDLRSLYSFTNQVDGTLGARDIAVVTLREAVSILRAEHGEIILSDSTQSQTSYLGFSAGRDPAQRQLPVDDVAELCRIALGARTERRFGPEDRAGRLRLVLGAHAVPCGMIAPIKRGKSSVGVLMVTGRTGVAKRFSSSELELLDTIANHASLTLERAQVIEQLQTEIAAKQDVIRSKDQLIAAVSHELRTPLTGVLGFAEMLRDHRGEFSPEDEDAMLQSIAAEASDLNNLVEDLLTAARARMGSLTIVPAPVPLEPLVARVVETTADAAHRVTVGVEKTTAFADEGRVRQIMRNLITNAQRYGGEEIEIATKVEGYAIHLTVSDNGDGIPEDDQERIFAPYESAHNPGTQPGSLGLGLAISRMLARLMDGDLSYRRRNGWTMFDFVLPAYTEPDAMSVPTTVELERV
jgi:signal transduction histidine kinase